MRRLAPDGVSQRLLYGTCDGAQVLMGFVSLSGTPERRRLFFGPCEGRMEDAHAATQ
jgi:hypothetical protein